MTWVQLRLFELAEEEPVAPTEHALELEMVAHLGGPGHEVTILAMVDTLLDRLSHDGLFPARVRFAAEVDYIDPADFKGDGVEDF